MDTESTSLPLAELLRPKQLSDVIGQHHLLGEGKPLSIAFQSRKLRSMILWGPPGVGKTTLARLTANGLGYEWIAFSAVSGGVKEIRSAMELAGRHQHLKQKTILFIDEIHRLNKAQQDSLLPYTESGLIVLIGATTENPSFEVNKALLSRTQLYILQALSSDDLRELLKRAQEKVLTHLQFEPAAEGMLIDAADGDGRRLLNILDQLQSSAKKQEITHISIQFMQNTLTSTFRRFDKSGDNFYDQISALHKSVRGSNPNAALYWLCRMFDGGADPKYLARRIIRMAWEDIGLADPRAIQLANDAANTYERLGSPEGELALAQAVIYLAVAPKSNAGYKAFNQAKAFVEKDQSREVPIHLRNAPTALMKKIGYGKEYRYSHNEPHGFSAGETYLPEGISEPGWYQPVDRGLEIKIAERMAFLKQLNKRPVDKT